MVTTGPGLGIAGFQCVGQCGVLAVWVIAGWSRWCCSRPSGGRWRTGLSGGRPLRNWLCGLGSCWPARAQHRGAHVAASGSHRGGPGQHFPRCPPVRRVDTITGREKSEKSEHVDNGATAGEGCRHDGPLLGWTPERANREVEHYSLWVRAERDSQEQTDDRTAAARPLGAPRRATGRLGCYLSRGT